MRVADKTVVALRYCMKNSQGEVMENILGAAPVEYLHGSGNIMPALEASLAGLLAGTVKKVTISVENDTQLKGSYHFDVIIDNVRAATDEEIAMGKPVQPKKDNECGPGCCC